MSLSRVLTVSSMFLLWIQLGRSLQEWIEFDEIESGNLVHFPIWRA